MNATDKIFAANRLPNDLDGCGWYEIADLTPRSQQTLTDGQAFDFAIIGAGFTGLSAAHRLAQLRPDATIAIFDAQGVGQGTAGRNSGFMVDLPHSLSSDNYASAYEVDKQQIRFNRYGIDFAKQLAAQFDLPDHVFNSGGKYHGATTEKATKHLYAFAASLDKLGEDYELLDAQAMQSLTGSGYYCSGLFAPGAVMIQPAAYINALADNLPDNVVLFEHCPITEIQSKNTQITLITPQGQAVSQRVLLTNNGHLGSFGIYAKHLMSVFLSASMTRELTEAEMQQLGGQSHWGLIPAEPMGSTVRRFGNRLVMRNQIRYSPKLSESASTIASDKAIHQKTFNARFPELKQVTMQYTWGGHLCLSRNNVHVFGEVAPRIYAAACQLGVGAAKGTASGTLLAEYVTGEDNPLHRYLLDMPPPQKLFPEPLMSIGASTVLKARQWLAGSDL